MLYVNSKVNCVMALSFVCQSTGCSLFLLVLKLHNKNHFLVILCAFSSAWRSVVRGGDGKTKHICWAQLTLESSSSMLDATALGVDYTCLNHFQNFFGTFRSSPNVIAIGNPIIIPPQIYNVSHLKQHIGDIYYCISVQMSLKTFLTSFHVLLTLLRLYTNSLLSGNTSYPL